MSRPQSVDGGRPVVVTVRLSQAEADALDKVQGSRSDALRSLIPLVPVSSPGPRFTAQTPPSADLSNTHIHQWARHGEYLDACGCGTERPHQAGTR